MHKKTDMGWLVLLTLFCWNSLASAQATKLAVGYSGISADHLTIKDYPGGHMMYLHRPSQEALSNDIVKFIEMK